MKKTAVLLLSFAMSSMIYSQTLKDEVELIQDIWGKEKKAYEAESMELNEKEITLFSPIFEEYIIARKAIGMERMQLIKKYIENFSTIEPKIADELAKGFLKNNQKLDQLHLTYFQKISKAIGAIKAAQWLQIESYIDAVVRAEVQQNLPFVKKGFRQ